MTTLAAHIAALNAKTQAWIDEDPSNRWASMYVEDLAHWAEQGITTVDDFDFQMDLQCYSDMHKDAYGFRPRGLNLREMSKEEIRSDLEMFSRMIQQQEEDRAIRERAAIAVFESRITASMELGASDRETAIRWIAEAEGIEHDAGYLCYTLGLPYSMEKQIQPAIRA